MKYQFFVSNLCPDTYLMTAVIMTLMKRSNSPGIPFSDIPPPQTELEGLDVLGLRLSVSRWKAREESCSTFSLLSDYIKIKGGKVKCSCLELYIISKRSLSTVASLIKIIAIMSSLLSSRESGLFIRVDNSLTWQWRITGWEDHKHCDWVFLMIIQIFLLTCWQSSPYMPRRKPWSCEYV